MKTKQLKCYRIYHGTKDLPSIGINKEVYPPSKQRTSLQCCIDLDNGVPQEPCFQEEICALHHICSSGTGSPHPSHAKQQDEVW